MGIFQLTPRMTFFIQHMKQNFMLHHHSESDTDRQKNYLLNVILLKLVPGGYSNLLTIQKFRNRNYSGGNQQKKLEKVREDVTLRQAVRLKVLQCINDRQMLFITSARVFYFLKLNKKIFYFKVIIKLIKQSTSYLFSIDIYDISNFK